jgi:hypothetical protein
MFVRFKRPNDGPETNINVRLVRDFEPGTLPGTSKINFLGGDSMVVEGSNRVLRHAFKKAVELAHAGTSEGGPDSPEAVPAPATG